MNKEDSLQFVHERLRHNHATLAGELRLRRPPRVTRRFAVALEQGEAHVFETVDTSLLVRCRSGSIWLTHDGDPKDVILVGGETYRCERSDALHLFALAPSVLEIQFDDEVTHH